MFTVTWKLKNQCSGSRAFKSWETAETYFNVFRNAGHLVTFVSIRTPAYEVAR